MKGKFINIEQEVIVNQKNVVLAIEYNRSIDIYYTTKNSVHSFHKYFYNKNDDATLNVLKTYIEQKNLIKKFAKTSIKLDDRRCTIYVNTKSDIAFFDLNSEMKPKIVMQNGGYIYLPSDMSYTVMRKTLKHIAGLLS